MKKSYNITDKNGNTVKSGYFTEPEVRMAAKAGFRIFELDKNKDLEITQGLTGLFTNIDYNKNNIVQ